LVDPIEEFKLPFMEAVEIIWEWYLGEIFYERILRKPGEDSCFNPGISPSTFNSALDYYKGFLVIWILGWVLRLDVHTLNSVFAMSFGGFIRCFNMDYSIEPEEENIKGKWAIHPPYFLNFSPDLVLISSGVFLVWLVN
jgi:hypothetical protein